MLVGTSPGSSGAENSGAAEVPKRPLSALLPAATQLEATAVSDPLRWLCPLPLPIADTANQL